MKSNVVGEKAQKEVVFLNEQKLIEMRFEPSQQTNHGSIIIPICTCKLEIIRALGEWLIKLDFTIESNGYCWRKFELQDND